MTTETLVFLLTIGLAFGHILVLAFIQVPILGLANLAGARDDLPASDNKLLGRIRRANENLKETLPWALGLLLLVMMTDSSGSTSEMGAWIYLLARTLYLPLYLAGVAWLRTGAWAASLVGLTMLAFAVIGGSA